LATTSGIASGASTELPTKWSEPPCFRSREEHVRTSPPGWYSSPRDQTLSKPLQAEKTRAISLANRKRKWGSSAQDKERTSMPHLARTDLKFLSCPNSAEELASISATGLKTNPSGWTSRSTTCFPRQSTCRISSTGCKLTGFNWVFGICHRSRRGYIYQHGEDHIGEIFFYY